MEILDNLLLGLSVAVTPINLLFLIVGAFVGMIVGIIPGFGPTAGIAVLLSLTFSMDPITAVIMLAGIYYGSMYGGTITSILINTPGESATVASTFDGFPLAKRGRIGPALVMQAAASFIGGTIGVLLISGFAPAFANFAKSFGPPEFFLIITIGLLALIVVMGDNKVNGAISALLGLAVSLVGVDVITGAQRFTYGHPELINGIYFLPVAIGLFGLGELFYSIYKGTHKEERKQAVSFKDKETFWPNKREWSESKGTFARGSVLGFFVGMLPGAGATVASLLSYSLEKKVSKFSDKFGKGYMPGLVAPESANNAASAGAMIPLLTLGIPGSGATAVLLGAFLMWGLQPGPLMMENEPEFAWGLISSMYLGNVILILVNIFAIPLFIKIMQVPYKLMIPVILILCTIGTYSLHGSIVETWIMLAFGLIGLFMKLYNFSPAALVLALVLGPMAEDTLRQTLITSGGSLGIFVQRPISLILVLVIVFIVVLPAIKFLKDGRKKDSSKDISL
ncbi:tripartite tricarboxylate transporter permease [Alteribacillus iranensis]|uniref:Putative tricarboxylic transport membrane protein n=1 Tax=Alteribacillus iranensis TaxID=930128 RepID=A0A1I2BBT0_9BACI|nr:tripartite tricarboxylate transporter permease [Alteribacillus iranensis]SFE53605.1 putative tricarboxylic transport membrane protein [Alteribacillus iranensis]